MKTVAWFGSIDSMQDEAICRLRDGIGLTALIPDDYTPHHSGFRLPEDLLAASPLHHWQEQPGVDRHRRIIGLGPRATPVFPGVVTPPYDDAKLLRLIDRATRLGVDVWAHLGLWGYGGDVFPELGLVDDRGESIPEEYIHWGVPICPNNTAVRDWTGACLQYIARNYAVKEIDVDHGHFPPPASIASLFGCCCPHCQAKAAALGYDFPAMKDALATLRQRIRTLTLPQFKQAAGRSFSFVDFLAILGHDSLLLDWFNFRAQSVADHMASLTAAVHDAVGDACPVDSHLFPPAIAYLSGQDFAIWENAVDRLTPGWGDVVGWELSQANTFAIWAEKLCAHVTGLDEAMALTVIYRLFGYEQVAMPLTTTELRAGRIPVADVMGLEIQRAAAAFSGRKPFFAPYRPYGVPVEDVRRLGEIVRDCSPAGFVTGGNLDEATMRAMQVAL